MEMQRRALYNSLRLNWLHNPRMDVQSWAVEDLRALELSALFNRLQQLGFSLSPERFEEVAALADTPEDMTDTLVSDDDEDEDDPELYDRAYLLVFEIWRRLFPERQSLSIFCDELDHLITLYDSGQELTEEQETALQDAVSTLQTLLDDEADSGEPVADLLKAVAEGCANDLEAFLFDYISDQIDIENFSYASELVEGFFAYVQDKVWFEVLRARVIAQTDPEEANKIIWRLVADPHHTPDCDLNFEILDFLVQHGNPELFKATLLHTLPLLQTNHDFTELLDVCQEFYEFVGYDTHKAQVKALAATRQKRKLQAAAAFDAADADVQALKKLL